MGRLSGLGSELLAGVRTGQVGGHGGSPRTTCWSAPVFPRGRPLPTSPIFVREYALLDAPALQVRAIPQGDALALVTRPRAVGWGSPEGESVYQART